MKKVVNSNHCILQYDIARDITLYMYCKLLLVWHVYVLRTSVTVRWGQCKTSSVFLGTAVCPVCDVSSVVLAGGDLLRGLQEAHRQRRCV